MGYLLLHYKLRNSFSEICFFARCPLYLSTGLSLLGIVSYLTVPFFVSGSLLTLISLICWFIIIFYKRARYKLEKTTIIRFINLNNILPLTLFIILFLHFSFIVGYYKWPPVGDLLSHGRTVSYLIFYQARSFKDYSYYYYYPFSFHALSADLSLLLGTYPGETVFLLGATILTIIPIMLYSLTFMITKSKSVALIPFMGSLIYHKTHLAYWFIGYFYNGPYPNLWGFLIFFTFFTICCLKEYFLSKRVQLAILLLLTLHMYMSYYSFVPFNVLCILFIFSEYKTITKIIREITVKRLMISLLLLSVFLYFGTILFNKIMESHNMENVMAYYKLHVPKLTFMSGYTINFYVAIFSIALSLYLWIKRKYPSIPLLYITIVSVLVLSTLQPTLHSFLFLLQPRRSFMIITGLSWVVLSLFIHNISNYLLKYRLKVTFGKRTFFITVKSFIPLSFIIMSALLFPLYSPFPINSVRGFGWFILSRYPDELAALEWIHENVPSKDVILGDASFASQFLHSFSAKGPFRSLYLAGEYSELRSIWRNPDNKTLVIHLLKKYNVSYVFVSSEWGWWCEHGYRKKPYFPKKYIEVFNTYDFLQQVFKQGDTAVYKVISYDKGLKT